MIFRCPNIQTDYNEAVLCLNFGTPENNEFSIWDIGYYQIEWLGGQLVRGRGDQIR